MFLGATKMHSLIFYLCVLLFSSSLVLGVSVELIRMNGECIRIRRPARRQEEQWRTGARLLKAVGVRCSVCAGRSGSRG